MGGHHFGDRADCEARVNGHFEAAFAIFAKWIIQAAEADGSLLAQTVSQSEAGVTTPPDSSFLKGEQLEVNELFAQRETA